MARHLRTTHTQNYRSPALAEVSRLVTHQTAVGCMEKRMPKARYQDEWTHYAYVK